MKEGINKVLSVILAVILVLMTTYPALALPFVNSKFDPATRWYTIETPHFNIHYYPEEASAAKKIANYMEDVHNNILKIIKKEPQGKTDIILGEVNGLATPFPTKRIFIPIQFTHSSFDVYSQKDENWQKMILIHEYTHILQLDRTEGITDNFRKIFGNSALVYDLAQPAWSYEGLATYTETRFTTGGRNLDSYTNMEFRSQFLDGQELTQEQINGYFMSKKILGANYTYGARLWAYIANTYGEDKIDRIIRLYAEDPVAGFETAIKRATGDDYDTIWNKFLLSVREVYSKQADEINAQGVTNAKQITHAKYGKNLSPKWSDDSQSLYYYTNDLDGESRIQKSSLITDKNEVLYEKSAISTHFDKYGDSSIIYSAINIYNNYHYYHDLYSYNLINGETKQLTMAARAYDPTVSPDGKKIVYVTKSGSMENLAILENEKTKQFTNVDNALFATPLFSPDGSKIVVTRSIGGYTEICTVDMNGNIKPIFEDKSRATNIAPSWSPDGRYILFSSDRTGVFNLYAYDLQAKRLYQVTNVITGATTPSVSPDMKKVAFSQYSYLGWDIHMMDYAPASWKEVSVTSASSGEMGTQIRSDSLFAASESKEVKTYESKPYNPLPTLMPTWWAPLPVYDGKGYGIGAITGGSDALLQHTYTLMAGVGPAGRAVYDITYINDQLPPSITFNISDSANWVQRHESKSVKVSYLHNIDMDTAQLFSIGYANDNVTNIASTTATPGILSGIQLGYAYSHLHRYYNSISNEEGYTFGLSADMNSKGMGSTFDTTVYTADSKVYFPLSENHQVLAMRATGVTSTGDPLGIYNYTIFLRGYPYGYLAGSGLWRGTAEYRFPISFIESGPHGYPLNLLYFDRSWGSFFVDSGEASGNFVAVPGVKTSAGAQYNIDTKLIYNIPMTFSVYYAYGFNDNVGSQFGFNISTPYLAGSW